MKLTLINIIFCLVSLNVFGQKQIEYRTLKSKGATPSHISKSAIEKNDEREITTSPYRPRKERIAEMDFYSSSTYAINELLVSGDVLYGEETHDYLKNTLNHILESNNIDKEINIHAVKSSVFNAFATQDPVLFINLGLLMNVRNEAELAFVICHELAHHMYNHNIEGYLESYKVEHMKEYNSLSSYDKILKKHNYSRSMESAADSLGLIYFKKTKFYQPAAISVFELMQNTDKIVELKNIQSSIDFTNYYNQIDKSKLDSLDKIFILTESESEELSTHPNTNKRIEFLKKNISTSETGAKFIQSEEKFKQVKKISALESLRMSLIEGDEFKAYLFGHFVLSKFPEYSAFARKQIVKSLIGILDRKLPSGSDRNIELFEARVNSESDEKLMLYYFILNDNQNLLDEISEMLTTILNDYPDDQEAKSLNNWFIRKIDSWSFNKIKYTSKLEKKSIKTVDLSGNKKIFTDPYFLSIDFRKEYMLDYVKTEKELIKVNANMIKYNKMKNNYHIISSSDKSSITSELLSEKDIINKRLMEISYTPEGKLTPFPADYYDINELCEKYKTQTVSSTFAATAYYKASSGTGVVLLFFFAPLGILYMATPNYITVAEYKEYNLIDGEIQNEKSHYKKSKFSGSPMRALYFPK